LAIGSEKQKSSRSTKQAATIGSGATIRELLPEKICSAVADVPVS